jgi:hypothetical protein
MGLTMPQSGGLSGFFAGERRCFAKVITKAVLALAKLITAGVPIANECQVLNQWR